MQKKININFHSQECVIAEYMWIPNPHLTEIFCFILFTDIYDSKKILRCFFSHSEMWINSSDTIILPSQKDRLRNLCSVNQRFRGKTNKRTNKRQIIQGLIYSITSLQWLSFSTVQRTSWFSTRKQIHLHGVQRTQFQLDI